MRTLTLRLPDDLHSNLVALAHAHKRSLNALIVDMVGQATNPTVPVKHLPDIIGLIVRRELARAAPFQKPRKRPKITPELEQELWNTCRAFQNVSPAEIATGYGISLTDVKYALSGSLSSEAEERIAKQSWNTLPPKTRERILDEYQRSGLAYGF